MPIVLTMLYLVSEKNELPNQTGNGINRLPVAISEQTGRATYMGVWDIVIGHMIIRYQCSGL